MDTLQAAVILSKMKRFPDEVEARIRIGARYSELLADADVVTPYIEPHNTSVYAQYTLQVGGRESVQEKLSSAGIPTAVHYPVTLDRQPALRACSRAVGDLGLAAEISGRVVSLPMHPYLTDAQIEQITRVF